MHKTSTGTRLGDKEKMLLKLKPDAMYDESGNTTLLVIMTHYDTVTHRPWRQASISIGAQLGNLEVCSSTRDFERWMKGAIGIGSLSLKRLSVEGLWGGLLYWGLRIRPSLSIWAPLRPRGIWNQEGGRGSYTGDFVNDE